jgi:hypothetical protein
METRTIKGMPKAQFLNECIKLADEINPSWEHDVFATDNFVPSVIWTSSCDSNGFALSTVGARFFQECLQLTPYFIECRFLYSGDIIKLSKRMPWPYTAGRFNGSLMTKIGIYSQEVAVWAALYDNDLEALLEAYSRE